MLAPRFSIRTLLVLLTAGAFTFLIAGMAVRGQVWAWGVTIGVLSLVVVALVHGAWFGVVWLFSQLLARRDAAAGQPRTQRQPAHEDRQHQRLRIGRVAQEQLEVVAPDGFVDQPGETGNREQGKEDSDGNSSRHG